MTLDEARNICRPHFTKAKTLIVTEDGQVYKDQNIELLTASLEKQGVKFHQVKPVVIESKAKLPKPKK